jgi:hypothetical protein
VQKWEYLSYNHLPDDMGLFGDVGNLRALAESPSFQAGISDRVIKLPSKFLTTLAGERGRLRIQIDKIDSKADLRAFLADCLGAEGWEYVGINGFGDVVWKRPKL